MKWASILSTVTKSYLYTHLAKDTARFLAKNFKDLEIDQDHWLHKAGLSSYRPAKSTFGGISIFLLGAAAGGVLGLALAPKRGTELVSDVKDKALELLNRPPVKGHASAHA